MRRNLIGRLVAAGLALGLTGIIAGHAILTRTEPSKANSSAYQNESSEKLRFSDKEPKWGFYLKKNGNIIFAYDNTNDDSIDEAIFIFGVAFYSTPDEALEDLRRGIISERGYIHYVTPDLGREEQHIISGREIEMNETLRMELNAKNREIK